MVGEAYVQIRAKGDLLHRDVDKSGKDAGEEFAQSFEDEVDEALKRINKKFKSDLADATANVDFSKFRREGETAGQTADRLSAQFKELADGQYLTSQSFKELTSSTKEWARAADIEDKLSAQARAFADQDKAFASYSRNVEAGTEAARKLRAEISDNAAYETYAKNIQLVSRTLDNDLNDSASRLAQTLRKDLGDAVRNTDFSKLQRSGESADDTLARVRETMKGLSVQLGYSDRDMGRIVGSLQKWAGANEAVTSQDRDFHRLSGSLNGIAAKFDAIGDSTGKMFGEGGRNNFLNAIGGAIGGLVKLGISLPVKALSAFASVGEGVVKVGKAIFDTFSESRAAGMSVFKSSLDGIGAGATGAFSAIASGGASLIPVLLGVGAAITLVVTVGPPMIAMLALLAGGIVAVVGAITIGLIGALLAIAPLFIAAAAAAGVLALAIKGVAEQKDKIPGLNKALSDFKATMKSVVDEMAPAMGRLATTVLGGIGPLITQVGTAVGGVLDYLNTQINSPTMKEFFNAWSTAIPLIITNLGQAITNLGLGLVAFFKPVLPYAQQLAKNFNDLTLRFMNWTQSASGQNSIAEFMRKAWEMAGDLWDILVQVVDITGTILSIGADTGGGGFLDKVAGWLKDINDQLQNDPETRAKWVQFFKDAAQFGRELGGVLNQIWGALQKVDWKKASDDANNFLDKIQKIGPALGFLGSMVNLAMLPLTVLMGSLNLAATAVLGVWDLITNGSTEKLASLPGKIGEILSNIWETITAPFRKAWDILLGHSIIPDIVNGVIEWFAGLPGKIITALVGVAISITTGFANGFSALMTYLAGQGPAIGAWFSGLPTLVGAALLGVGAALLSPFTGAFDSLTTYLASKVLGIAPMFSGIGTFISSTLSTIVTVVTTPFRLAFEAVSGLIAVGKAALTGDFGAIPGIIGDTLSNLLGIVQSPFNSVFGWLGTWGTQLGSLVSSIWGAVPSGIRTALSQVVTVVTTPFQLAYSALSTAFSLVKALVTGNFSAIPGIIRSGLSSVVSIVTAPFTSAYSAISGALGRIAGVVRSGFNALPGTIRGALSGVASIMTQPFIDGYNKIMGWVGRLKNISIPNPFSGISPPSWLPGFAAGGLVNGATKLIAGEAGPEAIVPLRRPLDQVDPSVRWLSAIAQGKTEKMASGGTVGTGRHVTVEEGAIVVQTQRADPAIIASQVLDRIAASL